MKYLMILSVGVCLFIASVPVMADQAEDEAAIDKVIGEIITTFNEHDAKAMMALCDPGYETPDGSVKGREAVTELYTTVFKRFENARIEELKKIGIVFITPDVAIYKDHRAISGTFDAEGRPVSDRRLTAWVMVKKDGKWLCAAYFYRPIEE